MNLLGKNIVEKYTWTQIQNKIDKILEIFKISIW